MAPLDVRTCLGRQRTKKKKKKSRWSGLVLLGPSIKYVTLFLANFYPPSSLSHFVTHPWTPHKSTSHISDPPPTFFISLITQKPTKTPLPILPRVFSGSV